MYRIIQRNLGFGGVDFFQVERKLHRYIPIWVPADLFFKHVFYSQKDAEEYVRELQESTRRKPYKKVLKYYD